MTLKGGLQSEVFGDTQGRIGVGDMVTLKGGLQSGLW